MLLFTLDRWVCSFQKSVHPAACSICLFILWQDVHKSLRKPVNDSDAAFSVRGKASMSVMSLWPSPRLCSSSSSWQGPYLTVLGRQSDHILSSQTAHNPPTTLGEQWVTLLPPSETYLFLLWCLVLEEVELFTLSKGPGHNGHFPESPTLSALRGSLHSLILYWAF